MIEGCTTGTKTSSYLLCFSLFVFMYLYPKAEKGDEGRNIISSSSREVADLALSVPVAKSKKETQSVLQFRLSISLKLTICSRETRFYFKIKLIRLKLLLHAFLVVETQDHKTIPEEAIQIYSM